MKPLFILLATLLLVGLWGCESSSFETSDDSNVGDDDDDSGDDDDDDDDDDNDDNNNNDNDDDNDDDNNDDDDNNNDDDDITVCIDMDSDWWCDDYDCNDSNPDIYPGAEEILFNDIDEDCDGADDTEIDTMTDIVDPIIFMDCSDCPSVGPSLDNMLCAFDICDSSVVDSHSYTDGFQNLPFCANGEDTFEAVERYGDESNGLKPKLNGSYSLMATGMAINDNTNHLKECYQLPQGQDPFATNEGTEMWDIVEWTMELTAPEEALAFEFKFVFFSSEYEEYVSSEFNDKFYVILEAPSTNGGAKTIINFTQCRKPDEYYDFICEDGIGCEIGEKYCYIAVNSAFSNCCWLDGCPDSDPADNLDISGTGFECVEPPLNDSNRTGSSTPWLQTTWPINGGEKFKLTFHLHDTKDNILDSEVILDSFRFRRLEGDPETIILE